MNNTPKDLEAGEVIAVPPAMKQILAHYRETIAALSSRCESLQGDIESWMSTAKMFQERWDEVKAALARERELHRIPRGLAEEIEKHRKELIFENQELRQVVKEYREQAYCGTLPSSRASRCSTCIKADLLLEPHLSSPKPATECPNCRRAIRPDGQRLCICAPKPEETNIATE